MQAAKILVLAAAALPIVQAGKGLTTNKPSTVAPTTPTTFTTAHGACECDGHCIITTKTECEAAALELFPSGDLTANVITTPNAVRGCSINNKGGLRVNTDLTSIHVHPDGRVNLDPRIVLCQECPGPVTEPAGCHTTEAPTTVATTQCPYVIGSGLCECDGYHTLTTQGECEAAALEVGHTDVTANVETNNNAVPGCFLTKIGRLVLNEDMSSTEIHMTHQERAVLCASCPLSATTPVHAAGLCPQSSTVAPTTAAPTTAAPTTAAPTTAAPTTAAGTTGEPFAMVDEYCDGVEYCTVETLADCSAGAAFLGASDTSAEEVDHSQKPPGCFISFADLEFNPIGKVNTLHGPNQFTDQICILCSSLKFGAHSSSNHQQYVESDIKEWWVYVAIAAGVAVVVAVVVVAVVLSRQKRKNLVNVSPRDSMTVVGGDTVAI